VSVQNVIIDVWECAGCQRHLKECVRMRGGEVGSRVSPEHEVVLIKVSSLRNHHLLGHRVVELPALAALRVPDEDTLLHVCPVHVPERLDDRLLVKLVQD
jgi:hypothetical protein